MRPVKSIHVYAVHGEGRLALVEQALREQHAPPYTVTIHPITQGPDPRQRALWKIWMNELCLDTGHSPREVENICLANWGPIREFVDEYGEIVRRPARFNDREMTYDEARDLMSFVQAFFADFGFSLSSKRHPDDPPAVVFKPVDAH